MQDFLIRPEGLLERFPGGGQILAIMVREIVTTDLNATLDPVLKLLRSANGLQRQAIGTGLGNAARTCQAASESGLTRRLQEAVRRQNDSALNAAFVSAYAELATAPSSIPPLTTAPPPEMPNALGRGSISDPRTNPFKPSALPNPLSPVRPSSP